MNENAVQKTSPSQELALQLEEMASKFREALPKHIPVERFTRVVATAIQQNPALLKVTRRSLWQAAIKAAQDGLLPDGREAALVIYKKNTKTPDGWVSTEEAQYMPMIAGIRKKVRNSGEIVTWDAHVVFENDEFAFELGDEPYIRHKPLLDGDRGRPIAAYSIATLKTGEKSREVISIREIEKVRAASRAKDKGPWVEWFEEMCRKTVARRHAKVLPMSTDLDDLIRRDDELYAFDEAKKEAAQVAARRPGLASTLDMLADGPVRQIEAKANDDLPEHDPDTGEVQDDPPAEEERQPERRSNARRDRTEDHDMRDRERPDEAPKDERKGSVTVTSGPGPQELGKQAATRGDDRNPPKSYGTKARDAWLAGYDAEMERLEADEGRGEAEGDDQ